MFENLQGMKKVLATALFPTWDVHFVPELELIEKHLDAGDEVTVLTCDAELGYCTAKCTAKSAHDLAYCNRCVTMRQTGLNLLSRRVRTLPLLKKHPFAKLFLKRRFENLDALKAYRVGNFDIGLAVLSSLVDETHHIEPDLAEHESLLQVMLEDSFDLYLTCLSYLKRYQFNVAYIFNGRFSIARAFVRACERRNVEYYTHERGGQRFLYSLFRNSLPHQPGPFASRIREAWEKEKDTSFREREAREFYDERRRGECSAWVSYVLEQDPDRLPEGWNPARRNLAIFASSEGELAGIQDYFKPRIYPSQLEGVLHLASAAEADPSIHLYLRVHPNSSSERWQWWKDSRLAGRANLTVIQPEDRVSSYALLDACETIFTFGSTMGMEATYSGKPSVLLSEAIYRKVGAVYEPDNRKDVEEHLVASLKAKPWETALPYGYFCRWGGERLHHSEPWGLFRMLFKGHSLDPSEVTPNFDLISRGD
jgi:hypothetical protein